MSIPWQMALLELINKVVARGRRRCSIVLLCSKLPMCGAVLITLDSDKWTVQRRCKVSRHDAWRNV